MGLTKPENEQLLNHINAQAGIGADSDSLDEKQEILEEIASLTDEDVTLIFNNDGTVEVEEDENSGGDEANETE